MPPQMSSWRFQAGRPFFTVSSTGINGGGSTISNGGADFGPDTTEGAASPSQLGAPYSNTSGIQEALNTLAVQGGGMVYIAAGSYAISEPIYNTGSNQTVVCDPGCQITFSKNTWALHSSTEPAYVLVGVGSNNGYGANSGNGGVGHLGSNFSYCRWIGNGATIDTGVVGYGSNYIPSIWPYGAPVSCLGLDQIGYSDTSSLTPGGHHISVDGFILKNVTSGAFYIGQNNYIGTATTPGVSYKYQLRNVRFSRIYATWYPNLAPGSGAGLSGGPGGSGFVITGSVRQTLIEDCVLNTSAVQKYTTGGTTYGNDISNCYISANAGDTQQVIVRRCTFIQPYFQGLTAGSTFELQGNNSGTNPSQRRDSHSLLLEDCVFDSGAPSIQIGGGGGGYVDDFDLSIHSGYIWNVEFRRCVLVNAAVEYRPLASQFGYFRYADGSIPSMGGAYPSGFSGTLTGRSPYSDPGITLAAPTSGSAQVLSYGFPVRLIVSGGSPTSPVSINGVGSGQTTGAFVLRSGDSFTLFYSAGHPPSVQVQAL